MIESAAIKESASAPPDVARVAGRGTIYITVAKLWFIVSGSLIHFVLPRLMTAERFGIYRVVVGIVSVINAVVVTGTYQTVSKYISQEPQKADSVKSRSLKLQMLVGGGISVGFFLAAPIVAALLNDQRLTPYLRLASLITLAYSFYSVYTGYFNGQKRFLAQAGLDMTYSTLKLGLIVLFVWLGWGVAGGVGGFALAAASVLLVSAIVAGRGERRGEVRSRELLGFQAYLLLFTLGFNLLQKVDLILIKSLSSDDVKLASESAAYYGAAIDLANITYQVILSVTFVIFPLVSEATFASDLERARSYVSNTLRYSLMIMALIATLFSSNAAEVIGFIYPGEYQAGTTALEIVAYGMLLFGLLYVITTIISASGRPVVSIGIAALTLAASAAFNAALIPARGIAGAAIATSVAMLAGVVTGGLYLASRFGALVPVRSVVRIAACAGVVAAGGTIFNSSSRLVILGQLTALSAVYLAALILTGELKKTELATVRRIFRR